MTVFMVVLLILYLLILKQILIALVFPGCVKSFV